MFFFSFAVLFVTNMFKRRVLGTHLVFHLFVDFYRKCFIYKLYLKVTDFQFISVRCSLWLTYGKLTNERSVVIVNTVGSMLFLLYTVVYYVFTVSKSSFLKQFSVSLMTLLFTIGYVQYETDLDKAIQTMGMLHEII